MRKPCLSPYLTIINKVWSYYAKQTEFTGYKVKASFVFYLQGSSWFTGLAIKCSAHPQAPVIHSSYDINTGNLCGALRRGGGSLQQPSCRLCDSTWIDLNYKYFCKQCNRYLHSNYDSWQPSQQNLSNMNTFISL